MKMENTLLELDKPLILPEKLREKLRKIYGEIKNENELPAMLKGEIFYSVGDVVTYTLLKLKLEPKIAIVDYRTKREEVNFDLIRNFGEETIEVENPPGMITPKLWHAVRTAIESQKKVRIDVKGEEDLAVIPVVHFSPLGAIVIYGMPYTGLIVLKVDEHHKENVRKIIREMEV